MGRYFNHHYRFHCHIKHNPLHHHWHLYNYLHHHCPHHYPCHPYRHWNHHHPPKIKLFLQGGECPSRKGGSSPGKVEIFKILIMIMTSMIIMIMIMTTMMIMIVMTMLRLPNYPLHAPTELKARQKKKWGFRIFTLSCRHHHDYNHYNHHDFNQYHDHHDHDYDGQVWSQRPPLCPQCHRGKAPQSQLRLQLEDHNHDYHHDRHTSDHQMTRDNDK